MPDGPDGSPTGATRRGVGAVAAGDGPRRRGGALWWLLGGVTALIVAGIVVAIVASGGSKHHHAQTSARSASPAAGSPGNGTPSTSAGASPPTTTSPAPTTAPNLPSRGDIGGGGVNAKPATGRFAPKGAIGTVLFAEDGTGLDANARKVIKTAVRELGVDHARTITVVGFTDGIGNARLNRTLSLERARKVARALRARLGGGRHVRIRVRARGKSRPVASNHTAQGRQLNRRVLMLAT